MENVDVTASAVISFAEDLEDTTAGFYEGLADRFPEQADGYRRFAKDSRRSKTLVVRTYQETISDALEACFCFEGLMLASHAVDASLPDGLSHEAAVGKAIALERASIDFYQDVAERSASLLATITGAFRRAAKTREKRRAKLEAMR